MMSHPSLVGDGCCSKKKAKRQMLQMYGMGGRLLQVFIQKVRLRLCRREGMTFPMEEDLDRDV